MNHVVRRLTETELPHHGLEGAMKALIHTIIFGRWPTEVRPDVQLVHHWSVSYAFVREAEHLVHNSLADLRENLIPAGPELLKGSVTLTFYKKRVNKVVFWSYEERVVWEEWVIPIVVNTSLVADRGRITADESRALQQARDSRDAQSLQQRLMEVAVLLNSVDHVPPVSEGSHEIEVSCSQREREGFARVMTAPPVSV